MDFRHMNDLYTRDDVAKKMKIGVRTVDTLVATDAIPYVRIRRSIRFSPTALDMWLKDLHNKENPAIQIS